MKTILLKQLEQGDVINYNNPITAEDINYVVLCHYENKWGKFTEVLNLETYKKESFTQHTRIEKQWSLVKRQNIVI